MERTAHADRIWVIGGAAGAVVLAALAWFFLISPQNAQTAALQDQASVERQRVGTLEHRLAELREQNTRLSTYETTLDTDRKALPPTPDLAEFLRELQSAGTASRVAVNGLTVGSPTPTKAAGGRAFAVPLTLTAVGSGGDLEEFLHQLQQVQPRAVLVNAVNATAEGQTGSLRGSGSLNLTLQVFTTMQGESKPN
jgi:Tfp pilus assembly protein PilO